MDWEIPLSDIYAIEVKIHVHKKLVENVYKANIANIWQHPRWPSIQGWTNCGIAHTRISLKEHTTDTHVSTWMNLRNIMLEWKSLKQESCCITPLYEVLEHAELIYLGDGRGAETWLLREYGRWLLTGNEGSFWNDCKILYFNRGLGYTGRIITTQWNYT